MPVRADAKLVDARGRSCRAHAASVSVVGMGKLAALGQVGVFVGFTATLACGEGGDTGPVPAEKAPAAFGDAACRLMFDTCACASAPKIFSSVGVCSDGYAAQLAMYFAEAEAAGLEYHPECMGEYIDFYTKTLGCLTQSELTADLQRLLDAPACKVHSGAAAAGEACTPYYNAFGDSCVQGLHCVAGTCAEMVAAPNLRLEGEVCDFMTDVCEPGTACVQEAVMAPTKCVRGPKLGEQCGGFCDVGLNCEEPAPEAIPECMPPPGEGEPCSSAAFGAECAPGLRCNEDVCTVGLPQGQECTSDESCAVGLECGEQDDGPDICQPEEALVCI